METIGKLHAPAALPSPKEPMVPIGCEVSWAIEPVWMMWRRGLLAPTGNRTLSVQPVARHFNSEMCLISRGYVYF
jgi:hypothetical protein